MKESLTRKEKIFKALSGTKVKTNQFETERVQRIAFEGGFIWEDDKPTDVHDYRLLVFNPCGTIQICLSDYFDPFKFKEITVAEIFILDNLTDDDKETSILRERNKKLQDRINELNANNLILLSDKSNEDIKKWEQRRWELFIADKPHLRDIHHNEVQKRLDDIDILINHYRKYPMKLDENNF